MVAPIASWEELPLLQPGGQRVLKLLLDGYEALFTLFARMKRLLAPNFTYKYDLLWAYLLKVFYTGQQRQPVRLPVPGYSVSWQLAVRFAEEAAGPLAPDYSPSIARCSDSR